MGGPLKVNKKLKKYMIVIHFGKNNKRGLGTPCVTKSLASIYYGELQGHHGQDQGGSTRRKALEN